MDHGLAGACNPSWPVEIRVGRELLGRVFDGILQELGRARVAIRDVADDPLQVV